MADTHQPAFCSCSSGQQHALPQKGQFVRVTLLKEVDSWTGNTRTVIPAGTAYEGAVINIDPEGFFDMEVETGAAKGFYAHDSTIQIEILKLERTT